MFISKPQNTADLLALAERFDELTAHLEQLQTRELIAKAALHIGSKHPKAEDGVTWDHELAMIYAGMRSTQDTLHTLKPLVDKCVGLVRYMDLRWYERYIADSRNHWINRSTAFRTVRIPPEWRIEYREPKPQQIEITAIWDSPSPIVPRLEFYSYHFAEYFYGGKYHFIAANQESNTVLVSE